MGNSSSEERRVPQTNLPRVIPDPVDASSLDPRISKWLSDDQMYTYSSLSKEPHSGQASQQQQYAIKGQKEVYQKRVEEPEMEALRALRKTVPLVQETIFGYEKPQIKANFLPVYQTIWTVEKRLMRDTSIVQSNQTNLATKMVNLDILVTKVMHNFALLGTDLQNFEASMKNVHQVEHSLRIVKEKLEFVFRKTYSLLDALPHFDQSLTDEDLLSPFNIKQPFLRKDQYIHLNLLFHTKYISFITTEEKAKEDYWLSVILPNWDDFITRKKGVKYWRGGVPYRLRSYVWRRLIGNPLGVTALTYASCREKARERYGPLTHGLTHHPNNSNPTSSNNNNNSSVASLTSGVGGDSESSEDLSGIETKEVKVERVEEKIEPKNIEDPIAEQRQESTEKNETNAETTQEKVNDETIDNESKPLEPVKEESEEKNEVVSEPASTVIAPENTTPPVPMKLAPLATSPAISTSPSLTRETVEQSYKQTTQELIRQGLDNIKEVEGTNDPTPPTTPSKPANPSAKGPSLGKVNTSPHNIRHQIMRDLPRTFPQLGLFDGVESGAYMQLLTVLESTVMYLPNGLSYVQGMSYLCGLLLMFMQHDEAFTAFANLLTNPFMSSVCRIDLSLMAKHSSLFQMLLAHNCPAIHAHFHDIELTTEHFLLDWWLTLYAKAATLPLAFRIWDCFLIEGEIFLHLAAVGMLKLHEKEILASGFEKCMDIVPQLPKHVSVNELFALINTFTLTPMIEAVISEMELGTL